MPFILLYEICLVYVLRSDQGTITNRAHEWLVRTFDFAIPEEVGLSFPRWSSSWCSCSGTC